MNRIFPGVINMPLQIRRGTQAERLAMTVPLAAGELLYVTDDQRLYIGNSSTLGGVQITGYTNEDAMDAAAGMLTSGVHTGITFTYGITQDAAGRIDAAIDLTNYNGRIKGDLTGSVFSDDSTLTGIPLIDGTSGKFNLDGTVGGHIVPDDSETYDLGSGSYRFRDLWLSGSSIHLGNAVITASGPAVNLPAGSTINGVAIGTGSGSGDGVIEGSTYKINIAASDSSLMVNTDSETVTASGGFIGDVTGNLTGDVTGNLTGDVTGGVLSATTRLEVMNILGDAAVGVIVSSDNPTPLTINGVGTLGPTSGQVYFAINAAKGSLAIPTTTAAGDVLGGIVIQGYDGSDYKAAGLIATSWDATATLSDPNPRSTLSFVSYGGGSTLRVASFDYQGVFNAPLQKTSVYSAAGTPLPSAATAGAGARACVSDATSTTFAAAYASGGANTVPVYSDGTNWYIG